MAETLDAFRYISYVRSRWRVVAGSAVIAVAIALIVSFAMTRQYTATARIVIEPPAGTDVRAAVAVSPIYLESLRTYEQFASGDSLFQTAVAKFGLHSGPIESQKKRVLKVSLLRNTRILEISATLPDPRRAQALAEFLGRSTVEMNRSLTADGDRDLIGGIAQQQEELRRRLQDLDASWAALLSTEPVQALEAEAENAATLRAALEQQVSNTELELADAAERSKNASGGDLAEIRKQESNARARAEQLRRQLDTLSRQAREREKTLAARMAHRDRLEAERKTATAQLSAIETQLREARSGAGFRGERLRLIDPGIVPERPSAPNVPLNVAAALLLGLVLPALWLAIEMSFQEQRAAGRRSGFQAVG
jgi:polysaccharide biosynthesis transport protein